MKRFLISIFTFSACLLFAAPEKPDACDPYYCSEYEWDNYMKRFDPLSIQWPLHYTGETMKDYVDGGASQIDIIFKDHYKDIERLDLSEYRRRPECPIGDYLSEGLNMDDFFICESNALTEPDWIRTGCSLVGVSMNEQTLNFNGGGCAKKIRNWTVIDWCAFKPNGSVNAERNLDQYALVKDLVSNKVYYSFDDSYGAVQKDGWYTFTQVVKILDDQAPVFESCANVKIELKDCNEEITLSNRLSDEGQCASRKLDVSLEVYNQYGELLNKKWLTVNNNQQISQSIGILSPGNYLIFWSANDGCGNYTHCNYILEVTDGLAPHLICIHNLSTSMDADHGMSIWAKDFVLKAEDLCSDSEPTISFSADSLEMSRSFDCNDGPGFHNLTIYATDINGNTSSCQVELFISDTQICNTNGQAVGGIVTQVNKEPLVSVEVEITQQDEIVSMEKSNDRGQFYIRDIPILKSRYTLSPKLNDEISQGLEPTDLILLSRHIFGSAPFDDVLEFAAADINNDAKIDLDDYWALAHLIYGIPFTIDNFKAWKFIDQKLYDSGINRASQLTVPISLVQNRNRYDLLALKSGDIDFSWVDTPQAETRQAPFKMERHTSDTKSTLSWSAIEEIASLILVIDFINIDDILNLNPTLDPSLVAPFNDGIYLHLSDEDWLNSNQEIHIGSNSKINTNISSIHFGNDQLERKGIEIEDITNNKYLSYDISFTPNPFSNRLDIKSLGTDVLGDEITIYNATGQIIKQVKSYGQKAISIDWNARDPKGILFVNYAIGDKVYTQKILRIP